MTDYLKKTYYVITTPVITNTDSTSSSSIYKYNLLTNGTALTNDICMNAYTVDGATKNILYYDDIVFYLPVNTTVTPNVVYTYRYITGSTSYSYSTFNNIYHLSNYISKRLLLLITDLQLANECKKSQSKPGCSTTFTNYTPTYPLFTSVSNEVDVVPGTNVVPGTTKKQKQIIQESNDVNNLIKRFNEILNLIKNSPDKVNYTELIDQQKRNEYLRNELDRKLREIYEYKNTNIVQSQLNLDNTVYTGVLWSILATSLAYFVFIKL